jgi:F-type H+-transporting ATPase subunit gamma
MQTFEELKRKLSATEDMRSVVRTMKSMAAVNIRQYEKAVESLGDYAEVVEMGLSVLLKEKSAVGEGFAQTGKGIGAALFGSDQGMCGQFNENVITFMEKHLSDMGLERRDINVLALGMKAAGILKTKGFAVDERHEVPASVNGINESTRKIWMKILQWRSESGIGEVYLFYNQPKSKAAYDPVSVRLLPIDKKWLDLLLERKWESRSIPLFTMNWDELFGALLRQYLYISIYRAFAESLNSENAARLSAMQVAEKNIEERIAELTSQYNLQRQGSITSELLDIISGFEALSTQSR